MSVVNAFCFGSVVYDLFDDGLANVLGLQSLNHGTNVFNNISIRLSGGNPACGHKNTGSTVGIVLDDTRDYFYMFKDSEMPCIPLAGYLYKKYLPRIHSVLSTFNLTKRNFSILTNNDKVLNFFGIFGTPFAVLSPIIKFRFAKVDPENIFNDPCYSGYAYKTLFKVEAWRIGMFGTLVTGVNLGWFARAKANPLKILTGMVQLVTAVALAALALYLIPLTRVTMAAAAIGALLV